jgi:MMPL family
LTFESLFDALDGIDSLDAQIANAVTSLEAIDRLLPQMITQLKIMTDQTSDDMINVGNDFDQSRSDFFYIPREAFDNEYVKTGMTLTMSPDGKAARFVAHEGNAMGPEGIEHVEAFPDAIKSTLTETSLAGSKIYIGGGASKQQRHQGVRRFRSTHRGDRRVRADLLDHVVHHAKSDGGSGSGRSIRPWRAEAAVEVPVLNARRLHERMGHHRPDEPETSAPQFNCELL